MTDRELLEAILYKINDMDTRITGIDNNMATKAELAEVKVDLAEVKVDLAEVKVDLAEVKANLTVVKADVQFAKETVINIENDHGQKLNALLHFF